MKVCKQRIIFIKKVEKFSSIEIETHSQETEVEPTRVPGTVVPMFPLPSRITTVATNAGHFVHQKRRDRNTEVNGILTLVSGMITASTGK